MSTGPTRNGRVATTGDDRSRGRARRRLAHPRAEPPERELARQGGDERLEGADEVSGGRPLGGCPREARVDQLTELTRQRVGQRPRLLPELGETDMGIVAVAGARRSREGDVARDGAIERCA